MMVCCLPCTKTSRGKWCGAANQRIKCLQMGVTAHESSNQPTFSTACTTEIGKRQIARSSKVAVSPPTPLLVAADRSPGARWSRNAQPSCFLVVEWTPLFLAGNTCTAGLRHTVLCWCGYINSSNELVTVCIEPVLVLTSRSEKKTRSWLYIEFWADRIQENTVIYKMCIVLPRYS